MEKSYISIIANRKTKSMIEKTAAVIFTCCAVVSILAVISITAYMFISGTPAIFKVGLTEILLGVYGILQLLILNMVFFTLF